MTDKKFLRPSYDEWQKWAQVVIDRLTTAVHVYSHPPHDDVFMRDKDRQDKNAKTLDLLRRIYTLTDDSATPTESLAEVHHHDERILASLHVLMAEMLELLPELSRDMQLLLKSPWLDKCNGRVASELFKGPMGNENEGIGSGYPDHGRLPLVLKNMLEQEASGDARQPRQDLHRIEDAASAAGESQPVRFDDKSEMKRRWADKAGEFMRRAGAVD